MMASYLTELGTRPMHPAGPAPCPVQLSKLKGLDISARYHPDRCGGDFFVGLTIDFRLLFLLSDIAIPAEAQALFQQRARELFGAADANESDAIAILAHDVNCSLMEPANGVRFAPTFLGCFNSALGILTYCNAGRVLAIFRDAKSVCVLERGGVPMGLFTHLTYEPAVLAFEPQDKLLLVTKGVIESRRGATEFGAKRLERLLEHRNRDSASQICDSVLREAYNFGKHPWSRVYDLLHSRKQRNSEDLTAVALVRR